MKPGLTDIAYFVDDRDEYRELMMVSLYSLMKSSKGLLTVHAFFPSWSHPSQDQLDRMTRIAGMNGSIHLIIKTVPKKYDIVVKATENVTPLGPMCCARFLLPLMLENVGQCLYVDCDTLFMKDPVPEISSFYDGSMAYAATAGVKDIVRWIRKEDIYKKPSWYVNGGVLLMDLDLWRGKDLGQRCMFDVLTEHRHFNDQDTVNFLDRPVNLPAEMNFVGGWINYRLPITAYNWLYDRSYASLDEAAANAVILHYVGATKPFNYFGGAQVPANYACMLKPFEKVYSEYTSFMERKQDDRPQDA